MRRVVIGRFSGRPFIVAERPRHLGSFEGRNAAKARRIDTAWRCVIAALWLGVIAISTGPIFLMAWSELATR